MRLVPIIAALAASITSPSSAQDRVLAVLLDDVGTELLAETRSRVAHTLTIDEIAAQGVSFPLAVMGPACTPHRACFFSGRYGFRPDNLMGQVLGAKSKVELPPTGRTLAERTTAHGLTSFLAGKYHVAHGWTGPLERGFSAWNGTRGNLNSSEYQGDYFEWLGAFGTASPWDGGRVVRTDYATTYTTQEALAAVQAGYDLVVCSFHAVHAPLDEPPPHLHTQGQLTTKLDKACAIIEAADTELAALHRAAVSAGYVILVWSDNGTHHKRREELGFPPGGGKGTLYESGITTFLLAQGPGIPRGRTCNWLVSHVDLYRTVLDLLGVPSGSDRTDSVSFAPALFQPTLPSARTWAYAEYFGPNGRRPNPKRWDRCVQSLDPVSGERWKYILNRLENVPPKRLEELYDLNADPGEQQNLAQDPSHAVRLRRMRDLLPD